MDNRAYSNGSVMGSSTLHSITYTEVVSEESLCVTFAALGRHIRVHLADNDQNIMDIKTVYLCL